jgi:hypothetical protein
MFIYCNNLSTTLSAPISSTATTIPLSSSAQVPAFSTGDVLAVTMNDAATGSVFEVIYATGASGGNLTGCTRGEEGTTAVSWLANDRIYAAVTAAELAQLQPTTSPYVGNPLAFVNVAGDSIDNFSSFTQVNVTSFAIPAGALTSGAAMTVKAQLTFSVTGSPTVQFAIKVGSQTFALFEHANGTAFTLTGTGGIQLAAESVIATAGSSGAFSPVTGSVAIRVGSTDAVTNAVGTTCTVNTTISNNVEIWAACSAANVLNVINLGAWTVELAYPGQVVT